MNLRNICAVLPAALLALVACGVQAQGSPADFPNKPVRWVVPFPPGGPIDVLARVIVPKLGERLGQPVLIDNRPGAGGNVATAFVMKAPPDGYNLLHVVPFAVTNPFFIKGSHDPRELAPVIQLANNTMLLLSSSGFPGRTVADVIAQIRAKPGSVKCGSSGALPTVGCELLRSHAGADMLMVMYKGNAPALNALMSGEIDLLVDGVSTTAGQIKSGRVRAIASITSKRGIPQFPDLPTVSETIPGFEFLAWHGLMAPKGTPGEIVNKLNREIAAVLALPEVRQRMNELGFDAVGGSPQAFGERIRSDYDFYGKVAKNAGIKPE